MEMDMKHPALRKSLIAVGAGIAAALGLFLASGLGAQDNLGHGRVSGQVVDAKKQPLAGVQIVAQSLTTLTTQLNTQTDKKGYFVVGGMGTGTWRFTASKSGYRAAVLDVDVRQLRSNPPVLLALEEIGAAVLEDGTAKDPGAALARANQLLVEEKYEEARTLLERYLSDHPDAYQVRLQIGMCWLKQGAADKAETELRLLLDNVLQKSGSYDKDPALSEAALAGLGEAAVVRGDLETGMKHFSQALEISPTNELLAYNVGEILFSNQKIDEAIQYYLLAVRLKKDWPKPYHKLGLAYLNKGDFPKALEYLRLFVGLDPQSPAANEARKIIDAIEKK